MMDDDDIKAYTEASGAYVGVLAALLAFMHLLEKKGVVTGQEIFDALEARVSEIIAAVPGESLRNEAVSLFELSFVRQINEIRDRFE